MSFIAGDILIRMAADVASLRKDMDSAKGVVEQATSLMKTAALSVAGAFSASMFAGWIKSAIDAGDEMNKLSQRTGIAVEDIGGLQLAFRLGGAESGAFSTSMAKLSKQIVDGNDAFKYLGIAVREADGTVRSAKDVLYDVADAFKQAEDGAGKSALAMEIFGKSGAELIPILNTGSEGLREMDEMSRKLGLTMDAETAASAEKFNDTLDLISLGSQGVARQLAAQLLPTLSSLAGTFLETMTSGDTLRKLADVLATALKGLFSAAFIGVEIFNTLGKTIGAAGAQLVAVMRGDFAGAARIGKEWSADIRTDWSETAATLQKVWTDSGGKTVESMVAVGGALKKLTPLTKEQEEAAKKAAEAAKKQAEEMDKLAEATKLENAGLSGDYLKKLRELVALRDSGRLSTDEYVKAVEALIQKQPAVKKQMEDEKKAADELTKTYAAVAAATTKYENAVSAETEALRKSNATLKEQLETAGLNERQIVDREAAILRSRATELEWQAAMEGGNFQLEEQARLLRERAGLLEQGIVAKEARAAADAWKETAKSIEDGLTDALMRGFESGKSFTENIVSYIKNAFKTLVADFIIRPIIAPMAGGMASMFSGNAFAGGGPGGGNIFSSVGNFFNGGMLNNTLGNFAAFGADNIGSFLVNNTSGPLNTFGGSLMQNAGTIGNVAGMFGNAFAGYGISKTLSGGYTTGGNTVNTIAALASTIFGPIAGVIGGIINRAFGRKLADTGLEGTFGAGDGFSGQSYNFYKGGWFRSDKTTYGDLDPALTGGLGEGFMAVKQQIIDMGSVLGLSSDAIANYTKDIKFSTQGLTQDQIREKLVGYFTEMSDEMAASVLGASQTITRTVTELVPVLQETESGTIETMQYVSRTVTETINGVGDTFIRQGETASEALARLSTSFVAVQGAAELLFGIQLEGSLAVADLASKFVDLFGGVQNFQAAITSYYANFYSESEKYGAAITAVKDAMEELGYQMPMSRDGFRALVDSLDLTTESGREAFAQLMSVSEAFAAIVPPGVDLVAELGRMGGVFTDLAIAGVDAQASIVGLAGGFDAFMQLARGYISSFYSESEQASIEAIRIADALKGIGFDGVQLATRTDFRSLVEGIDVSTETGQQQLVELLRLGPSFAQLADYMAENNVTLQQLIDAAPQVAALEALKSPAEVTAESTAAMADSLTQSNDTLAQINAQLASIAAISQAAASSAAAAADAAASAASIASTAASNASLANSQPNYTYDVGAGESF